MKRPIVLGLSALASVLVVGSALAQPDADDLEVTMTVSEPDGQASGSQMELEDDADSNDVDEGMDNDLDEDQADDLDDSNELDDADDVDEDEMDDLDEGEVNDGDVEDGEDDGPDDPDDSGNG